MWFTQKKTPVKMYGSGHDGKSVSQLQSIAGETFNDKCFI